MRSIVGILPLLAVAAVDEHVVERAESVHKRGEALIASRREEIEELKERGVLAADAGRGRLLLGVVVIERVLRIFERLFD